MKRYGWIQVFSRGSATGAGLNKRKYSGKELITFAGYDSMDYHARRRAFANKKYKIIAERFVLSAIIL